MYTLLPGTGLVVSPDTSGTVRSIARGYADVYGGLVGVGDGTADDVQTQAAIDALPTITGGNNRPGGKILLSEGGLNIAASVNLSSASSIKDIVLQGMGIDATFVKPAASISMFTSSRTDLEIGSGGIFDMTIDGQWSSYNASFFKGIPYDFTFERLEIQNFNGNGSTSGMGIWLIPGTGSSAGDRAIKILFCLIQDNVRSIYLDSAGIGGVNGTLIQGNGINGQVGLLIDDCMLTHIFDNGFGTPAIHYAANMSEITINGNARGNRIEHNHFDIYWSDTAPASLYHAVGLDSALAGEAVLDTLIKDNYFWGNVASKTGAVLIRVQKGAGNAVQKTRIYNNHVETAGAAGNFLDYSDVTNLTIRGNDMGAVPPTTPLTSSGANSGVTIKQNIGIVTENSGASTGTGAQQTIAHGLAVTPTRQQIALTAGSATALPFHSADPDGTNIYVTAALNQAWYWATVGT